MSEQKEKKPLNEMRLLLESNMFEEVSDDNIDRLDNFYTPFQIKLRLKVPLDNAEYNMALQFLGLRGYYEGHTIPTNPDNAAFIIKESDDGEKYIQTLIRKSMLEEIENFIEEDENFNEYMKEKCKSDFNAFNSEKDFIVFAMQTSGPSENFSHILTYAASEIKENTKTSRNIQVFINNNLTEKEIESYITPYKEGVKSSYEYSRIAVPGMNDCNDHSLFTESRESLRTLYKVCNNKNIITDDIIRNKNFLLKLIEKNHLSPEYNIDVISKNYISLRRVCKYLFNEYYSLYDLAKELNYRGLLKYGAMGETEVLSDLTLLLKQNMSTIIKNKEDRESY